MKALFDREQLDAAARLVHATMTPTAQIRWPLLSRRAGAEVWVKHENQTPVGSFKLRGGLVYVDDLRASGQARGLAAATRGNHGQSVALAAALAGLSATVVVPRGNSVEKNRAMAGFGAELVEHGADFNEAFDHMARLAEARGLHRVPSFHPLLACGVATYALELFGAVPDLDTVYVPIGLGSGICGVITARDLLGLKTRVVGVVAATAPCYALSFAQGEPVSTDACDTLADGVSVRVPDAAALAVVLAGAERVVSVGEDEIRAAMRHYFSDTHNVAEGAGAAPLAALLQERARMAGKKVALVLSGANVDRALFRRVLAEGEDD